MRKILPLNLFLLKRWLLLIFLLAVLFLAGEIRIWQLGENPAGFFCDEASIGYDAYSLLTTGKDGYGKPWPIFFHAFGEYKNPIMIYSAILPIRIWGLNEFSVRVVSAFYGVLGVIAIYFLAAKLGNPVLGLPSALFLAISPWDIHFSRVALEGLMPFVFFTTLATYFWVKHWRGRKRWRDFILAIFLFALALYSYFPARIFIPLFCIGLVFLERKGLIKNKRKLFWGIILSSLLLLPLFFHTFWGAGFSRWNQVKPTSISLLQLIKKYIDHFSFDFLFFLGDAGFPGQFITRHSIKRMGELYLFQIPLLVIGFYCLFKNIRRKENKILLLWFLFYPLGSVLTQASGPQATRSVIGVVPFQITSAVGLMAMVSWLKKRVSQLNFLFKGLMGLVVLFSFINYFFKMTNYPLYSADYWGWQYGPSKIIAYFKTVDRQYDQLLMTNRFNAPQIFFKFYDSKGECSHCRLGDINNLDSFSRQLFAVEEEAIKEWDSRGIKYDLKKVVFYPDGTSAFFIIEPFFQKLLPLGGHKR